MSTMPDMLDLEVRKRRIRYRAWHRGMREVDLMLGRFVDAHLDAFDTADVDAFEALLDVQDQTVFEWLMQKARPDAPHDTPLWSRLVAFHGG